MFTQKVLFAIPGFAAALALYLYDGREAGQRGQRSRGAAWLALGFALPILVTLGFFTYSGALAPFIELNFPHEPRVENETRRLASVPGAPSPESVRIRVGRRWVAEGNDGHESTLGSVSR